MNISDEMVTAADAAYEEVMNRLLILSVGRSLALRNAMRAALTAAFPLAPAGTGGSSAGLGGNIDMKEAAGRDALLPPQPSADLPGKDAEGIVEQIVAGTAPMSKWVGSVDYSTYASFEAYLKTELRAALNLKVILDKKRHEDTKVESTATFVDGRTASLEAALATYRTVMSRSALVSQPHPEGEARFPYQKTFDAIAAATKIEGGHISISVRAFIDAFPDPAPNPEGSVAWRYQDNSDEMTKRRCTPWILSHGDPRVLAKSLGVEITCAEPLYLHPAPHKAGNEGLIEANFPIAEGSWNLVIYGAYHRASLMPCDPQSHGMHDKRSGLSEHCSSIALACCSAFLRAKLSSGGDE